MNTAVILQLALRSAWSRRLSLGLTLSAVVLAAILLAGVERVRSGARTGFETAVAGTDLVVGARGAQLPLVLQSFLHLGGPLPALSWPAAESLARHPAVAWSVPLSFGDQHRGFPVVATSQAFFQHIRLADGKPLAWRGGRRFDSVFEAVIGADVARRLGYALGQTLVLSHGSHVDHDEHDDHDHAEAGPGPAAEHADKPFQVVGILAPTGTPLDRGVLISLESMEAIHLDWQGGMPVPGVHIAADQVQKFPLVPDGVSAVLVGLKQRNTVLAAQRAFNEMPGEPLTAAIPAVVLDELWQALSLGERALQALAALVALVSMAGLAAVILAGMAERRRELAILRSLGVRPSQLVCLLALEGGLIGLLGGLIGLAAVQIVLALAGGWLQSLTGLDLASTLPGKRDAVWLLAMLLTSTLASLLPAWQAYRWSLADGLSPR
ncbi:MAG: ABC transporter permease [Uliginosibacterium sp.]|nr:ABC transporter permease [Uliginosibacterium sp.]